jgi:hypothetical protein
MRMDWVEAIVEGPAKWVLLGAVLLGGPAAARGLRPAAKTAIKRYLATRDRLRDLRHRTGEPLRDLYAEPPAA